MDPMDDLVQFLRDRLDEDEQTARAASWDEWDSSHWTARHREQYDGRWVVVDHAEEGVTDVTPHAADDAAVAQHIARYDPARVLREVEAKRRIIDGHTADFHWCPMQDNVFKALALAYADHPDYRNDWRP
ncbi:DUF6221 family protein [Streptomyces sp. NPDC057908]|uniref:DUF6221 family protein n=1 Tax=Streptomyces sp. NPDC057908 TaxID=3346276 RepID=UPI0036E2905D